MNPAKPLCRDLTRDAEKLAKSRLASRIRCCDPRIADLCQKLLYAANSCRSDWPLDANATLQVVAQSLVARTLDPNMAPDTTSTLRHVRGRVAELVRIKLETEVRSVVGAYLSAHDREVILALWGWTAEDPRTFQSVGDRFGINGSQVFGIAAKLRRRYDRRKAFLPVLERVLRFVARRVPTTADFIETELKARGLTLSRVPLERIVEWAERCGLPVPFALDKCEAVRVVEENTGVSIARLILKHAHRAISRFGLANKLVLTEKLAEATPNGIDLRLLDIVVSSLPGYEYLGQGWFRAQCKHRSSLPFVVRKILAVAPRIHVLEMCAAIADYGPATKLTPPREVVLRYCRSGFDCDIEGEMIRARHKLDPSQILNSSELVIMDVFRTHGPLLSRRELEDECVARGVPRSSFRSFALQTPIISRYARGVYRLRGTARQGDLERLAAEASR